MALQFDYGIFSIEGLAGQILPGTTLGWFASGTSTPLATYSDAGLTIPNTNPVVVGADGRIPPIWLSGSPYKLVTTLPDGTILTRDPIVDDASEIAADLASTAPGEGASLIGTENDGTVQDAITNTSKVSQLTTYPSGTLGSRYRDAVNIRDFPYECKMDGTDDTVAFTAAYEKACERKCDLLIPSGAVTISGLDLGGASHRGCSIVGESYDGRNNAYLSSSVRLKNGSNRPLFRMLAGDAPHAVFRDIILDGNQDQQASPDPIVVIDDDMVTTYPFGVIMENVGLQYGRGGGLKIGQRRGGNNLINVGVYDCGGGNLGHGIEIDTYDVIMEYLWLTVCYGYGLKLNRGSQIQGSLVFSYFNDLGGLYIGDQVTDCTFLGGSFDNNKQIGVNSIANANTTYDGSRTFVGTRFLNNGTQANNSYADIAVGAGSTELHLQGCSFQGGNGSNLPSYAIQFVDTNGRVRLAGNRFAAKSKWASSQWTNNYGQFLGPDIPGFPLQSRADGLGWTAPGDVAIGGASGTQLRGNSTGIGFYGATPIAKPSITGSRGGNAALTSLLGALGTMGLLTDSTTA